MLRLYESKAQPHLEYACIVRNPHLQKDILTIERIQKFGFQVCSKSGELTMTVYCMIFTLPHCTEGVNFLVLLYFTFPCFCFYVPCFTYLMGLCHFLLLQYLSSPHPILVDVVITYSCWSLTLVLLLFNTHFLLKLLSYGIIFLLMCPL